MVEKRESPVPVGSDLTCAEALIVQSRHVVGVVLVVAAVACVMLIGSQNSMIVSVLQGRPVRAEQLWNAPIEPWEDRWARSASAELGDDEDDENPLTIASKSLYPRAASWYGDFADSPEINPEFVLKTGDWVSTEDQRFYGTDGCMPNPFPDLPPGFLCSAPGTGVYLLDNYGNPYNRRIQRKVRAAMDKVCKS
jgi:hypothetical protein